MATFRTRIAQAAKRRGRLVLANDYASGGRLLERTLANVESLHPHLCAIKLNFHLLLPLGASEIRRITAAAHRRGLQVIADIKLNDIPATNLAATRALWAAGADAVIANPVMGPEALSALVESAHARQKGVITLCHMSSPEARRSYEMRAGRGRLYQELLGWALGAGADGIIAGATYPDIIRYCARRARGRLDIFSPGVGAQGGDAGAALGSGTDYVIAGRSVLGARDPARAAALIAGA